MSGCYVMYRLGVCMCNPESGSLIVTSLKLIEVVQVLKLSMVSRPRIFKILEPTKISLNVDDQIHPVEKILSS